MLWAAASTAARCAISPVTTGRVADGVGPVVDARRTRSPRRAQPGQHDAGRPAARPWCGGCRGAVRGRAPPRPPASSPAQVARRSPRAVSGSPGGGASMPARGRRRRVGRLRLGCAPAPPSRAAALRRAVRPPCAGGRSGCATRRRGAWEGGIRWPSVSSRTGGRGSATCRLRRRARAGGGSCGRSAGSGSSVLATVPVVAASTVALSLSTSTTPAQSTLPSITERVLLEQLDDVVGAGGVLLLEVAGRTGDDVVDAGLRVVVADVDERLRLGRAPPRARRRTAPARRRRPRGRSGFARPAPHRPRTRRPPAGPRRRARC